jgi:predicted double-glycine peptidase
MRPRFQADADFNHKIVVGLRRREPSIDFVDAHDGGVVGVSDPEVLEIAAESWSHTIETRCLATLRSVWAKDPAPD